MKEKISKEEIITAVSDIIDSFTTRLTLRQIFYQLVVRHLIPNTMNQYKRLSRILVDARHSGQINWDSMEDRTRTITGGDREEGTPQEWFGSAKYYLENCWRYFKLPHWLNQENYVEVWFEKQALEGIFDSATSRHDIVQLACKGYSSHDVGYKLQQRIDSLTDDRKAHILYFGDWDPSGLDIYRFIQDMAEMFDLTISFERIAITQDQIQQYQIPPMMAKSSDSRYAKFAADFGEDVVELDALDPDVLTNLIHESIEKHFDLDEHRNTLKQQEEGQKEIKRLITEYAE